MDILDINPEVLETTATIIEEFCRNQKELINVYLNETSAMSSEWTDDRTLGTLIEEIKHIKSSVEGEMDEILMIFPKYFRDKAEIIRTRPKI